MKKRHIDNLAVFRPFFILSAVFTGIFFPFALFVWEYGNNVSENVKIIISVFALIVFLGFVSSILLFLLSEYFKNIVLRVRAKVKFVNKLYEDYHFRALFFTYTSFAVSTLMAIIKVGIGAVSNSVWFTMIAVYTLIINFGKSILLWFYRKSYKFGNVDDRYLHGIKLYRISGIFLTIMSIALYSVVLYITTNNKAFHYTGKLIYVIALYDLYNVVRSIEYLFKARKQRVLVINSLKVISTASLCFAILSLQTAILAKFGNPNDFRQIAILNTITGSTIGIVMAITGITIITVTIIAQYKFKKKHLKQLENIDNGDTEQMLNNGNI